MAGWVYDARARRYRDPDTGRFISSNRILEARDGFRESQRGGVETATTALVERGASLTQWQTEMRELIKTAFIDEYLLGRGGRNAMTQRDWGIIGRMLRDQYAFLRNFASDLSEGELSPAQARMRARMYIEASTQAYERGRAEAHGLPRLPQYPADGNTQCRANCKCHLEYDEKEAHWEVYWVMSAAEHCPDCIDLEGEWAPLVVPKG